MPVIGRNLEQGITVQVKDGKTKTSLSMTIHNKTVDEVYHSILYLFESLEKDGEAAIYFYNTKNKKVTNDGENQVQTLNQG